MTTRKAAWIAVVAVLASVTIPMAAALNRAHHYALRWETDRAVGYAREVVKRTDSTADQIAVAIRRISADTSHEPCSAGRQELMRQIDITSSYIQAVGHVTDGWLDCSSLGIQSQHLMLGPVDVVTDRDVKIRANVEFPFAKGQNFVVIEARSYAAIIHKSLPVDIVTTEDGVIRASFTTVDYRLLSTTGPVRQTWLDSARSGREITFVDGANIVVVLRSLRYPIGAVVTVPIRYVSQRVTVIAKWAIPLALLAGFGIAATVVFFVRAQVGLPAVLKDALRRDEFFVLYQPVVDLNTGQWVGAEALVRWQRQTGELVRPDTFIPVAEETGIIQRITQRVMSIVERDARSLFRAHPSFHVAINLSPVDLHSRETIALVKHIASNVPDASVNLMMEATERGFVDPAIAADVVKDIRALGIRVAIDDFGTGFSSLSHLESLHLDILKIAKTFVDTIGTEAATSHVVWHIVDMSKGLGLTMIAEGVETKEQAASLREHGVQFAQGWLYAKPLTLKELMLELDRQKRRAA